MEILNYPNPILRYKTKMIKRVDDALKECVADMVETMSNEGGLGLAANQVGLPFRMFVIDWEGDALCLVNPVVRSFGKITTATEACLSMPDLVVPVRRQSSCHIKAWSLDGNHVDQNIHGDLARVVQHEVDHLDGTLMIDKMPDGKLKDPAIATHILGFGRMTPQSVDMDLFNDLESQYC